MAKIGQKGLYTKCGKPLSTRVFGGFGEGKANVRNGRGGRRILDIRGVGISKRI
jgi:hypothetical protein